MSFFSDEREQRRRERWAKMFDSKDLCALCAEPSIDTLEPDDDEHIAIQDLGRRIWPCHGCGAWWHISCFNQWTRFEDWCTNCESQLDETVLLSAVASA